MKIFLLLACGASVVSVVSASQALEPLSDEALDAATAGIEAAGTLTYAEAISNNIAFAWVDSQGNLHAIGIPGSETTNTCSSCNIVIRPAPPQ